MTDSLLSTIEKLADLEGLFFFGVAPLDVEAAFDNFQAWLSEGKHAGMEFLERHREVRKDPRLLCDGVDRALVFGLPYDQGMRWQGPKQPGPARVAQYARLRDYHKVLRKKLETLYAQICLAANRNKEDFVMRVAVDSAPLLERAVAASTLQGFIGKNTCFIHPQKGSLFVLGELLTNLPISASPTANTIDPKSRSSFGGCGSCQRCQVKCPTGALDTAYQLNANRCLAYWTIEHRGEIPFDIWPWLGTYYFGCDICQLVCPYNRKSDPEMTSKDLLNNRLPEDLYLIATMDQGEYELYFGGTPMTRAKRSGLQRNALIAMAVRKDHRVLDALAVTEGHPSAMVQATRKQVLRWLES